MYPHHRLNSSGLVVLLQQWTQADAAPRPEVAEQLGQWLSTGEAVTLGRALHAIEAVAPDGDGGALDLAALDASFQRTKADLTELLTAPPPAPKPVRERPDNTRPHVPDLAEQAEFGFQDRKSVV